MRSVSISFLALFRIYFGLVLVAEGALHFTHGWLEETLLGTQFQFKYPGFGWVVQAPDSVLVGLMIALTLAGALIALGWYYRWAAGFFFLGYSYVFLCDSSAYLNFSYFLILLSFLMTLAPAHRSLSLDVHLKRVAPLQFISIYWRWILLFQIGIVYFYAAIAKINYDWLVRGEPMETFFLAASQNYEFLADWVKNHHLGFVGAWLGFIADLIAVPGLLWRRTRIPMLIGLGVFHLSNLTLFWVGAFPVLMLGANLLFLDPKTFDRWAERLKKRIRWKTREAGKEDFRPYLTGILFIYTLFQVLIPLRHYLDPRVTSWTENGHRFAWRMMLRAKFPSDGTFFLHETNGRISSIQPQSFLNHDQAASLIHRPDFILQFAHHLRREAEKMGKDVEKITASVVVRLNGHPPVRYFNRHLDLLSVTGDRWIAEFPH